LLGVSVEGRGPDEVVVEESWWVRECSSTVMALWSLEEELVEELLGVEEVVEDMIAAG